MPDEINDDRLLGRKRAREVPHAFVGADDGFCSSCGQPEETQQHSTYARFTDAPVFVVVDSKTEKEQLK